MSGNKNTGRGQAAGRGGGRRNPGRGRSYANAKSTNNKVGLCEELKGHIFDYGTKTAADTMRTTQEKIVHHVGAKFGEDIANELLNRTKLVIPAPGYTQAVLAKHTAWEALTRAQQATTLAGYQSSKAILESQLLADPGNASLPLEIAKMDNNIAQVQFEMAKEVEVQMTEAERNDFRNAGRIHTDRVNKLNTHRGQVFALIMGQCTQLLQDKMKQDPSWNTVMNSYDPLALYTLIERVVMKQTDDQYPFATVHEHEQAVKNMKQNTLTNAAWYERFNTRYDVAKSVGVMFDTSEVLRDYCAGLLNGGAGSSYATLSLTDKVLARKNAEERYMAFLLVHNSGPQHDKLRRDLQNDFTKGTDNYPETRSEALMLLDRYSRETAPAASSEGTAFAQKGKQQKRGESKKSQEAKKGTEKKGDPYDKEYYKDKECYKCGKTGHPKSHCPNTDSDSSSTNSKDSLKDIGKNIKSITKAFAQLQASIEAEEDSDSDEQSHFLIDKSYIFTQIDITPTTRSGIEKILHQSKKVSGIDLEKVILLDSQSTVSLFCNPSMVTNIRKSSGKSMKLQSNGGCMNIRRVATLPDFHKPVWFSTHAITNILSLKCVSEQYHVTYDSYDQCFVVHRQDIGMPDILFHMHPSGLHYYQPEGDFSFVTTVSGNMLPFTKRQIEGAEKARSLYASLSYPSMQDFKWILRSNQIKDCPVTVTDAEIAMKIWGPNIAALKGKTVRTSPDAVVRDVVLIPKEIRELHRNVTLSIDIFFVNGIAFFITLSRNISFTTVTHLTNRSIPEIYKAFRSIFKYYFERGFQVTAVMGDGEFAPLEQYMIELPGAPKLNLTSANEHEPYIERRIRVVKERARAVRHSIPFTHIPQPMLTYMIFYVVKLLNYFPVKGGISEHYSPKAILAGEIIHYKYYAMPFGTYCQVHEEDTPRNSMAPRTQGAISLGPSGNVQGGHKFYNLTSGRVVTRRSWTVIPMPELVIQRVNTLGKSQPADVTFTDRHGRIIGDVDPVPLQPSLDYDIPGVVEDDVELPGVDTAENTEYEAPLVTNESQSSLPDTTNNALSDDTKDNTLNESSPPNDNYESDTVVETTDFIDNTTQQETIQPIQAPRRSSRIRQQTSTYVPSMKGKSYSYTQLADPRAIAIIMAQIAEKENKQISLKMGIDKWGERAINAAEAEMKQLHWRNTFEPVHYKDLTEVEKKMVLESHIFLTEKRTGEIKARTVSGGNKQRDFISKEEASSPTVATESVLLTCTIDAMENRDVAVIDIPNAFIQTVVTDKKDQVIIRVRGRVAEILVKIAPEVYSSYLTRDKRGQPIIYVRCLNAIYGTMVASLLYYEKFTGSLRREGYTANEYDPCVWNKEINGKQMTICFHVDDCKLSHVSSKAVDETIEWIRSEYENVFEDGSGKMKVHRGKEHTYLGMKLDFSRSGIVKISMSDYVKEIVTAWDKQVDDDFMIVINKRKMKNSAAPDDLFKINEDSVKLDKKRAVAFHNIVARSLYITKRARPDICVPIAFLTTRVREPDQDDWRKLGHLIEYLRGTMELPLILGADGTGVLKWYTDASFAVHPNMRGHTGGGLTLGRGYPIVSSTKQKLNTRSSTESELVGVDDMMPSILWTRYFLNSQGYKVLDNILYQDNKSAILLEKNGKASSSKRTKHINVRYFFITNRIKMGEVNVDWCPTSEMVADFMTKPLQGAAFRKFRDLIMGTKIKSSGAVSKSGRSKSDAK